VSRCKTNARLRDPIPVRSTSSGFLNTLLPFLLVLLDCTPPFSLFLSSPFVFDYLPSTYLFSAQLWNISGIIIFPFVITLVSRSNSLWSPSPPWVIGHTNCFAVRSQIAGDTGPTLGWRAPSVRLSGDARPWRTSTLFLADGKVL